MLNINLKITKKNDISKFFHAFHEESFLSHDFFIH